MKPFLEMSERFVTTYCYMNCLESYSMKALVETRDVLPRNRRPRMRDDITSQHLKTFRSIFS